VSLKLNTIIQLQAGDVHYAELTLQMPKDETKSLLNHTKKPPPPPPAYSAYFDDPTIYAQIDHCNYNGKSSTTNLLATSGQSLNNGSLKTVAADPNAVQFTQMLSPLTHTSTSAVSNQAMLLTGNNIGSTGCISNSGAAALTSSTTPTFTSISTTSQYPASNYQTLPVTNKQFLRDHVTVKAPLSFSEQESCV